MEDNSSEPMESLRFIIKIHREEFERRRAYEWRVILMVMTFYALAAGASVHKDTSSVVHNLSTWTVCIGFFVFWIIFILFLGYVNAAHRINRQIAHHAEEALEKCINGEEYRPVDLYSDLKKKVGFRGLFKQGGTAWAWLMETILLLFLSVVVVSPSR